MSTLGAELERALAYLEILKIRMGDRLTCRPTSQMSPAR
jgi:LytS/YehU family sensor histidine kinase